MQLQLQLQQLCSTESKQKGANLPANPTVLSAGGGTKRKVESGVEHSAALRTMGGGLLKQG